MIAARLGLIDAQLEIDALVRLSSSLDRQRFQFLEGLRLMS